MPYAQLSRVRMQYYEYGAGPETVLFVHGFEASARVWQLVQQALPPDRYRSIAPNNRGAGETDAPPDDADFGVTPFARDLHELVLALGLRDFTLAGHSLGGAIAARFAVDHPELVKALVLVDSGDPEGRDGTRDEIERIVEQRMAARRPRQARGDGGAGIDARSIGAPSEFLRLLAADIEAAPERRLRGSLRSMYRLYRVGLGEAVRGLPMPVLIAGGDADKVVPIGQQLTSWTKYPPGTGLQIWHGVGHFPNVDVPDQLAALLRQFIEQTVPARLPQSVP